MAGDSCKDCVTSHSYSIGDSENPHGKVTNETDQNGSFFLYNHSEETDLKNKRSINYNFVGDYVVDKVDLNPKANHTVTYLNFMQFKTSSPAFNLTDSESFEFVDGWLGLKSAKKTNESTYDNSHNFMDQLIANKMIEEDNKQFSIYIAEE